MPEVYSPSIHLGATADSDARRISRPGFHGTLVRTDNAINPASRTLLVEVDVDNADGKLLPGAYAFVHFTLPGARGR